MKLRLKSKWFLSYLLVLAIPLLLTGVAWHVNYTMLYEEVINNQQQLLKEIKVCMDAVMRQANTYYNDLFFDPSVKALSTSEQFYTDGLYYTAIELKATLRKKVISSDNISSIAIYMPASDYIVSDVSVNQKSLVDSAVYNAGLTTAEWEEIRQTTAVGAISLFRNRKDEVFACTKILYPLSFEQAIVTFKLSQNSFEHIKNVYASQIDSCVTIFADDKVIYTSNVEIYGLYENEPKQWFSESLRSDFQTIRYLYLTPESRVMNRMKVYVLVALMAVLLSIVIYALLIKLLTTHHYQPIAKIVNTLPGYSDGQNEFEQISRQLTRLDSQITEKEAALQKLRLAEMLTGRISTSVAPGSSYTLIVARTIKNEPNDPLFFQYFEGYCRSRFADFVSCTYVEDFIVAVLSTAQDVGKQAQEIQQHYPCIITSEAVTKNLSGTFALACDRIQRARFFGLTKVATEAPKNSQAHVSADMENRLYLSVVNGKMDDAEQTLETFGDELLTSGESMSMIRYSLYELSLIFYRLRKRLLQMNPGLPELAWDSVNTLESIDTLSEIYLRCRTIMAAIISYSQTEKKDELYEKALQYIDTHFTDAALSAVMIADAMEISGTYLTKIFHRNGSSGVVNEVQVRRVEKAKELLSNGNQKLSDVAQAVGFSDVGSFIRVFKKFTNATPGAYRLASQHNGVDKLNE